MSDKLRLLVKSGYPLILMESSDEERAFQAAEQVAERVSRPLFHWSMTHGLVEILEPMQDSKHKVEPLEILPPGKAVEVLKHLIKCPQKGIYVFKDLGPHCQDALTHRLLRDLLDLCPTSKMTLLMVEALPVPQEIQRFMVRYELGWPSSAELEEVVKKTFQEIRRESLKEIRSNITRKEMDQLVQSLRGLSCREAARVVSMAIYNDHQLDGSDLPKIIDAKRLILGNSGCLESIAADFAADDIGGLTQLKSWLKRRRGGFSQRARDFGLEAPRGVLMLGIPGCGKSLCAKVVAADWGMPLLRLDPGVLYQKYIGESESQLRQALRQAEAMAPAILWIDEIEKAFASASASSADGGLSKRMFGSLLSWMQDHRHPIFIVATANDISALPPELMRKGRFDEIFFVDLPRVEIRQQILSIHLQRRNQNPARFDLSALAELTHEFSGSELEQVIISGLFHAFYEEVALNNEHLQRAVQETRPLAIMTAEKVADLRRWAANRCVSAD